MIHEDEPLLIASKQNQLYWIDGEVIHDEIHPTQESRIETWHQRCGHVNKKYILQTSTSVIAMDKLESPSNSKSIQELIDCTACCQGRMPKKHLPRRFSPTAHEVGEDSYGHRRTRRNSDI